MSALIVNDITEMWYVQWYKYSMFSHTSHYHQNSIIHCSKKIQHCDLKKKKKNHHSIKCLRTGGFQPAQGQWQSFLPLPSPRYYDASSLEVTWQHKSAQHCEQLAGVHPWWRVRPKRARVQWWISRSTNLLTVLCTVNINFISDVSCDQSKMYLGW